MIVTNVIWKMLESSSHFVESVFMNQAEGDDERTNILKFSHVWNEFIDSLRMEDLINNKLRLLLAQDFRHSMDQISYVILILFLFIVQGEGFVACTVFFYWHNCCPVASFSPC